MGNTAGGFSISAHTKELIEDEVKRMIDEAYQTAPTRSSPESKEEWERLAQGLLEYETLTGEEIERVIRGEPPEADDEDGSAPAEAEEKPSLIAIPKTKPKSSPGGDGGMEPEPSA
jgi:cell division protease FtsH